MSALLVIAQRDLLKLLRDRPRLAVNMAFPMLLIAGLGSVLRTDIGRATGLDAVTLAFTGVLAATAFQSTAAGMISLAEDRETDFSAALFVTPVPRMVLLGGKILGETAVALAQCCCVVVFAGVFGVSLTAAQLAAVAGPCVICCLLGGAFGLATVAALPNQRSAMQVFQFLIIPQYVLAGVIVPSTGLPGYLDVLAHAMPLRYAVDLTRTAFYAGRAGYGQVSGAGFGVNLAVTGGLFAVLLAGGASLFDRRERVR